MFPPAISRHAGHDFACLLRVRLLRRINKHWVVLVLAVSLAELVEGRSLRRGLRFLAFTSTLIDKFE